MVYTVWLLRAAGQWEILTSAVTKRVYKVLPNAERAAREESRKPWVARAVVLQGLTINDRLVTTFVEGEREE